MIEQLKQAHLQPVTERTTCRVCGSADLVHLFSLGTQFVSDFVSASTVRAGIACPIELQQCRSCTLVQQRYTAPQEFLYTRHYWYRSGVTQTMRSALEDVTTAAERIVDLKPGDVVLDIGANDGTLLNQYLLLDKLVRVAVEPAKNLEEECRNLCEVFIPEFWSADAYRRAMKEHDPHGMAPNAKVVTAVGMFYDLDDPNLFIKDVARVLRDDGVFIAQLMCLKQTVKNLDVGNLAHEHLEFYTLKSLQVLFANHGLQIFDVEENDVNGGSYRLFVRHAKEIPVDRPLPEGFIRVMGAKQKEIDAGLFDSSFLGNTTESTGSFFRNLQEVRDKVVDFVRRHVGLGKRVWAFGASTKGNCLLQWYGLDSSLVEAAVDRSPEKVGKYTIGTGIPIHSEEMFREANPEYALCLPYAFLGEFIERELAWLRRGGKFIVPLPVPRIVSAKYGDPKYPLVEML